MNLTQMEYAEKRLRIELQAPRFTSIANVATEQAPAFSVAAATT